MSNNKDADSQTKHFRPEDFPSGSFKPHGDFDSILAGRILRTNASGPFNEELPVMADKARRTIFAKLGQAQSFAVITVVQNSAMCSPGARQIFALSLKALAPNGIPLPVAIAWVINEEVEGKSLITQRLPRNGSSAC